MSDLPYGDQAGFTAYWQERGKELPASWDNEAIAAALVVASDWIDQAFLNSFPGLKVGGRAQVRQWPRYDVQDMDGHAVPSDSIPREVTAATYEAMFRQLTTPGIFFTDYKPGKYKSVSISGALSVEYAVGDAYAFQTQMPQIAAILAPLFGHWGSYSGLSGGSVRA